MYTQVWTKFLPVIRIMLKRAVASPQLLTLNRSDFDKAGGGKKVGFRFIVELSNTKLQKQVTSLIAKDLVTILQQDEAAAAILSGKNYELELNPKCELNIRFIASLPELADVQEQNPEIATPVLN